MTEGPHQRKLVVDCWSPHIVHLSGSILEMCTFRKNLSVE